MWDFTNLRASPTHVVFLLLSSKFENDSFSILSNVHHRPYQILRNLKLSFKFDKGFEAVILDFSAPGEVFDLPRCVGKDRNKPQTHCRCSVGLKLRLPIREWRLLSSLRMASGTQESIITRCGRHCLRLIRSMCPSSRLVEEHMVDEHFRCLAGKTINAVGD